MKRDASFNVTCMKKILLTSLLFSLACSASLCAFRHETFNMLDVTETKGPDIHGFFDLVFKNDYITPRGLLVTDTGLTTQVLGGFIFDVYKNPKIGIDNLSFFIGAWNDIWAGQDDPNVDAWNELDWFIGGNIKFFKRWKFNAMYVEFLSPPGHFKAEQNAEFTLFYEDGETESLFKVNPYLRLFWAISGDSTVVVGKHGGTYYIELGMTPTIDFTPCGLSLILFAPTWFSLGPANFWDGSDLALKHAKSNFGVFSTGITGKIPFKFSFARLGDWYVYSSLQYYYLINKNLLEAQKYTLNIDSISDAHRNVVVAGLGIGFNF